MGHALIWFRRDLRLDDHPALQAALRDGLAPVPVYIHAPEEEAPWAPGGASRWWLHHSLAALAEELKARGSTLVVRSGDSLVELERLLDATGAEAVYWHRLYEPAVVARDTRIKKALRARGIRCESLNGALLAEPWQVQTGQGDPYRVFTPFWKRLQSELVAGTPSPAPSRLPTPPPLASLALDRLRLLPRIRWDRGFHDHWQPGEPGAQQRLSEFLDEAVGDYARQRDRPDIDGTSRLSPHLHHGELSPRRVLARLREAADGGQGSDGIEVYRRELGWREFSHHLLHHFPDTPSEPLNRRFDAFPWRDNPALLAAWQRGRTGIPIVDAGMRQMWRSGWMHNRVRMVVASLLTKNLLQHWQHGAGWFWDTLVDASLANNTQGWQWSAGCGADAAPYFRIFNPVAQGERFDPDGRYVAAWVPELARVPTRWRQRPWQAPAEVLDAAGLAADSVYRAPVVDLAQSRDHALAAYATVRAGAG